MGATALASPSGADAGGAVDWGQVRAFRQQAAELLTAQLRDRSGLDEPARREIGRALIVAMLRDHADSLLAEGAAPPSAAQERALAAAIFDALFGLGRLQPLVDDPDVENIEITGCDRVHLVYGDGRVRPGPPVADSDEELIETLAFLAARSGGSSGSGERAFTPANPILDLTLHGGARLAARAWITPRPTVVIRRHRLTEVNLADLQRLGMVDGVLAEFLAASVRANKTSWCPGRRAPARPRWCARCATRWTPGSGSERSRPSTNCTCTRCPSGTSGSLRTRPDPGPVSAPPAAGPPARSPWMTCCTPRCGSTCPGSSSGGPGQGSHPDVQGDAGRRGVAEHHARARRPGGHRAAW
jgi:hypothetical protein